jgi:hypothetical protein
LIMRVLISFLMVLSSFPSSLFGASGNNVVSSQVEDG